MVFAKHIQSPPNLFWAGEPSAFCSANGTVAKRRMSESRPFIGEVIAWLKEHERSAGMRRKGFFIDKTHRNAGRRLLDFKPRVRLRLGLRRPEERINLEE